jgi:hypothetical protein
MPGLGTAPIHDDVDTAVAPAYGWPAGPETEDIHFCPAASNAERVAEERQGVVRYPRPELSRSGQATRTGFLARRECRIRPALVSELVRTAPDVLATHSCPVTPAALAKELTRARATDLRDILDTLVPRGPSPQVRDPVPTRGTVRADSK